MATIEIAFVLSAPARKALGLVSSPQRLNFMAERFFDQMRHERYRDFAVEPQFFTNPHGFRSVKTATLRPRGEKVKTLRARLAIETLQQMKRLQARGLSLNWQMEEILYFGFRQGLLYAE